MSKKNWWHNSVNYCIYIRSFFDSNNDGLGDIKGIEEKLDYLEWLGITSIWITPFYPTADFDLGYDVINYLDIDSRFGSWSDFESLLDNVHKRGMKMMMDIVPNHTSFKHEWFQKALADVNSEYRDYYIFKDPKEDGGLPNNWLSHFGGPAWTLDESSNQYYLHLFFKEQPDLNWRNPKVHEEFINTVKFWVNKGIDGFRIDITQGCYKHKDFLDQPWLVEDRSNLDIMELFESQSQIYALAQPETPNIFIEWKKVATEINPSFTLMGEYGEINLTSSEHYFFQNDKEVDGFDSMYYTLAYKLGWDYCAWVEMLSEYSQLNLDQKIAWTIDSSERPRSVSRYGGGEQGVRRAKAMAIVTLFLPGFPHLYMGQELGLEDMFVAKEDVKDGISLNDMDKFYVGRDKVRTHMPFSQEGRWNGFSQADKIWLNSAKRSSENTVEVQMKDTNSVLNFYKNLIDFRKSIKYSGREKVEINELGNNVFEAKFDNIIIVCNMGEQDYQVNFEFVECFTSCEKKSNKIVHSESATVFML